MPLPREQVRPGWEGSQRAGQRQASASSDGAFRGDASCNLAGKGLKGVRELLLHLFPRFVPKADLKIRYTFCLGGLAFSAFLVLLISGLLLSLYYRPDPKEAYGSILFIEEKVFMGRFLRGTHRLSSDVFLVLLLLHMLRVVFTGAYRFRSYNWCIGLLLLMISVGVAYTGYALPMDQLAYWATQTGTTLIEAVPFGGITKRLLVPDGVGGALTLVRFYVLHIVLLPLAILALISIHFYRVRKDGGVLPYL